MAITIGMDHNPAMLHKTSAKCLKRSAVCFRRSPKQAANAAQSFLCLRERRYKERACSDQKLSTSMISHGQFSDGIQLRSR